MAHKNQQKIVWWRAL